MTSSFFSELFQTFDNINLENINNDFTKWNGLSIQYFIIYLSLVKVDGNESRITKAKTIAQNFINYPWHTQVGNPEEAILKVQEFLNVS